MWFCRFLSFNIPKKHFIYLPLGPRFARFYGTASLAQAVQVLPLDDSEIDTTADIQQSTIWKTYGRSGKGDAVLLQASTDGMNPFNKNKTSYSMWQISLAMLNLPRQIRYLFGRLLLVGIIPGDYVFLIFVSTRQIHLITVIIIIAIEKSKMKKKGNRYSSSQYLGTLLYQGFTVCNHLFKPLVSYLAYQC